MFDYENCTLEEFWKHVASHLSSRGIETTLVGGGVATIYSQGKYMSGDLDFVFGWGNNHKEIKKALSEIGFTTKTRVFSRPGCPFTMDFSSPPVDIGNLNDPEIRQDKVDGVSLSILTPTECIKDRLHKAYHWKDELAMQAALEVAKTQSFSLSKVKKFCADNNVLPSFEEFETQYNAFKKAQKNIE